MHTSRSISLSPVNTPLLDYTFLFPVSSLSVEEETAADGSQFVLRRHLIQSPSWLGTQFSDQVGLELTAMFLPQPPVYWNDRCEQVQLAERSWLNPSKIFPLEDQSFFFLWTWGFSYKPLDLRSWAKMFLVGKVCICLSRAVCWGKFYHKSQSLWVFPFSFWWLLFHPRLREGPLLLFLFFFLLHFKDLEGKVRSITKLSCKKCPRTCNYWSLAALFGTHRLVSL